MKKIMFGIVLVIIVISSVNPLFAGYTVLYPTADTEVSQGSPDGNWGNENFIQTIGAGYLYGEARCFFKFSLSSIPDWSSITSANLYLWSEWGQGNPVIDIYHASDNVGGTPWNENSNSISWNNQPSYDVKLSSTIGYANGWESFNLLSLGNWNANGDLLDNSLSLVTRVSDQSTYYFVTYGSKEYGGTFYSPRLEISYEPGSPPAVPIPGTLLLLGSSLAGIAFLRKTWKN